MDSKNYRDFIMKVIAGHMNSRLQHCYYRYKLTISFALSAVSVVFAVR